MDKSPDDKVKTLEGKVYADFAPTAVPAAPDGGIPPGFAADVAPSRPEATEDNYVCLRGPCRHLWEIEATAGEGNPRGTFEALGIAEPRARYLSCLAHPGTETELSRDEIIFDCTLWDPLTPADVAAREQRRDLYWIRRKAEQPTEDVPADLAQGEDDDRGDDDEGAAPG